MGYRPPNSKNPRPLSAAEQAGMINLMSGIKKLREIAIGKPSVAQGQAGEEHLST